jgi:hypothetical protein
MKQHALKEIKALAHMAFIADSVLLFCVFAVEILKFDLYICFNMSRTMVTDIGIHQLALT